MAANIFLVICIPFRFLKWQTMEEGLLAIALPGIWIFLLFFARFVGGVCEHLSDSMTYYCRSAKLTGPFVQMIYSMIAGDMIRFAIIASIFMLSFSQGTILFVACALSVLPYVYIYSFLFPWQEYGHETRVASRTRRPLSSCCQNLHIRQFARNISDLVPRCNDGIRCKTHCHCAQIVIYDQKSLINN